MYFRNNQEQDTFKFDEFIRINTEENQRWFHANDNYVTASYNSEHLLSVEKLK